jgi:hypothetical protein
MHFICTDTILTVYLLMQRGLVLLSLFDANCAQIINTSAGEVAVTAMSHYCLEQLLLLPLNRQTYPCCLAQNMKQCTMPYTGTSSCRRLCSYTAAVSHVVILLHSPSSFDSVLPMLCIPHASHSPAYHRLELLLTAELYSVCLCTQLFTWGMYCLPCGQYSNSACRSSVFESDARHFGAALPFKELSRQYTPCAWALVPDAPEVLMIEDLTKDAR